jgi:zinc/manganese transport system substrate-binding protein
LIPRGYASLAAAALLLAPAGAGAAPALKVVTTTEGLGALVREVGGERVEVANLSRGTQDPHFVDANPTLAVKLRDADLLVDMGLDLEVGWLPPLVNQSRNPDIQPTGSRRLTAAQAVQVMDQPTGPVDRSQGDLHPAGNPHFLTDPRQVSRIAEAIAQKLAALDPAGAAGYQARLGAFQKRLASDAARWSAQLAPFRGQKIFTKHRTLTYFADWSGLLVDGYLEPKPGIEPPPSHLAELVQIARADKVRAIVVETYYDARSAAVVSKLSGARVAMIPGDVGASRTASSYEAWMDEMVKAIAEALRA